jgi:hypothetical protein
MDNSSQTTTLVCARYNEDLNWLLPLKDKSIIIYNKGEDNIDIFPENKIIKLPNLGREGGTYLHHIIQNYDNLSDYIIFTQANPVDHICHDNIEKSYKTIFDVFSEPKTYNFKYISTWLVKVEQKELTDWCSGMPSLGYKYCSKVEITKVIDDVYRLQRLYPDVKHELTDLIDELSQLKTINIEMYKLTELISKNPAFMSGNDHDVRQKFLYSAFDCSLFLNKFGDDYKYGSGAIFVASKKNIQFYPKSFWETIYSTFQDISPAAGYGLEKMWRFILDDLYIMLNSITPLNNSTESPATISNDAPVESSVSKIQGYTKFTVLKTFK